MVNILKKVYLLPQTLYFTSTLALLAKAIPSKNALNAGNKARLGAMNAVVRASIDVIDAVVGAKLNVVSVVVEEYVRIAKVADDIVFVAISMNVANVKAMENAKNAMARELSGVIVEMVIADALNAVKQAT